MSQQPALLLASPSPPRPITTFSAQQLVRKHSQRVASSSFARPPKVTQLSDQLLHALIHVANNAQNVALIEQRAGARSSPAEDKEDFIVQTEIRSQKQSYEARREQGMHEI